jgi:hypothetical protein
MTHIKRDGQWFCGADMKSYFYRMDGSISFTDAHHMDFKISRPWMCKECVKEYFNRLDKLGTPVII